MDEVVDVDGMFAHSPPPPPLKQSLAQLRRALQVTSIAYRMAEFDESNAVGISTGNDDTSDSHLVSRLC
jgi:hypothetical protein